MSDNELISKLDLLNIDSDEKILSTSDSVISSDDNNVKKESIKVLTIGDPHFKTSNTIESEEFTNKLLEVAKKINPDIIVCLGDILDRHETIHVSPLMRATECLKKLSEISKLYAIIGNHDRPNNSNYLTDEHPFNALKHWPNTNIIDKVVVDNVKGYKFVFAPYVPPGRFMEALETVDKALENTCAIFAHQEFYGAKMGVITSLIGDNWPLEYPLVISGHIHDYDELQSNIFYVGTPMQHAFGDRSDKGLSLFTFYTNGHYDHERIDLQLTKRIIVYLTPSEVATYEPPEKFLVKLVIQGSTAEIKPLMKTAKIKELTKKGIKISYKYFDPTDSSQSNTIDINQHQTFLDSLYKEISSDIQQIKWFEKLFGKINV